jgi:hypothetical protein
MPSSLPLPCVRVLRALLIGLGMSGLALASPDRALAQSAVAAADLPDAPGYVLASATSPRLLLVQASSSSSDAQPPSSGPTLGDLGLSPDQTRGDTRQQTLLDRRTHMLKVHQRLGLITVLPVAAACISSIGAPPDHGQYGNTTSRDIHVGLGGLAVAMYGATAYYAIRAPKASNEPARGGIKLHKYLIYLHAPGMVLTPILGAMAYNQINSGQKVHGIASAHGAVASVTAVSYGAAILAVTWPLHFKY